MAKHVNGHHLSGRNKDTIVADKTAKKGREVWRIAIGGQRKTLVTSSHSVSAMDQAMSKYERALKRLADR